MPGRSTIRGYIEKKKDYLDRAHDYQQKDKQIRYLKQKAKDRNPDEFNYHMIRSQVRLDGVHQDLPNLSDEETEVQKLLSDVRDLEYVKHKLSAEQKFYVAEKLARRLIKIEKLKSVLHFSGIGGSSKRAANNRIVFVNTEEEADQVRKNICKKPAVDEPKESKVDALVRQQYDELKLRMKRANELKVALKKLELKKDLQLSKGHQLKPQLVKKGGPTKAAQYKWTFERKK